MDWKALRAPRAVRAIVLGLTLGLLVGPVLVDLVTSPRDRPFGYAAADTFYYLTVARNIARHAAMSFDGAVWSNAFHPFWQLVTGVAYFLTEKIGAGRYVVLVVILLSLGFVTAGVWYLGLALSRQSGRLTPMFMLLPVGAYGLVVSPMWLRCGKKLATQNTIEGSMPVYGTLWSYANGMESGPVIFFFGLAAYFFCRNDAESRRAGAALGGTLALLVLARLDHALIAAPLLASYVASRWVSGDGRAAAVRAVKWFFGPVLVYIAANQLVFGNPVPVSGKLKSTFPVFTGEHMQNLKDLLEQPGYGGFLGTALREAQIFVPMLFACLYLATSLVVRPLPAGVVIHHRSSMSTFDRFLVPVAVGVLLLGSYDLLFVPTFAQGHWYFPVSTTFVSLAVISWVGRVPMRSMPALAIPLAVAWTALAIVFFVTLHRHTDYHAKYAKFYWRDAPLVRAHYGAARPKLIECDDGIVNFSLDYPAMSAELGLDPEGAQARREKRLLNLAYERGFDRVTSLVYASAGTISGKPSKEQIRNWTQDLLAEQNLSGFTFAVDYVTPSHSLAIVRAEKK